MNINIKDVVGIDGIYTSDIYRDYYAVDFYISRGGAVLKMRYPYRTRERATQMLNYLNGRAMLQPAPDYRRDVWFMNLYSGQKQK